VSELTLKVLEDAMRRFPPPAPDPFDTLFRPRAFCGLKMIVQDPVPKIRLSQEVAELVGKEFAAKVNAWLVARFGFTDPLPPLMFGNRVVLTSKDYNHIIRNVRS
jgi:hypothetical protein